MSYFIVDSLVAIGTQTLTLFCLLLLQQHKFLPRGINKVLFYSISFYFIRTEPSLPG